MLSWFMFSQPAGPTAEGRMFSVFLEQGVPSNITSDNIYAVTMLTFRT